MDRVALRLGALQQARPCQHKRIIESDIWDRDWQQALVVCEIDHDPLVILAIADHDVVHGAIPIPETPRLMLRIDGMSARRAPLLALVVMPFLLHGVRPTIQKKRTHVMDHDPGNPVKKPDLKDHDRDTFTRGLHFTDGAGGVSVCGEISRFDFLRFHGVAFSVR